MAFIAFIPFVLTCLIYRKRNMLDEQQTIKSIGSIYEGKNVKKRDHKAFLFPILFFWRRTCFVVVTVLLFDFPVLQM